jgi:hypothetical protein
MDLERKPLNNGREEQTVKITWRAPTQSMHVQFLSELSRFNWMSGCHERLTFAHARHVNCLFTHQTAFNEF